MLLVIAAELGRGDGDVISDATVFPDHTASYKSLHLQDSKVRAAAQSDETNDA